MLHTHTQCCTHTHTQCTHTHHTMHTHHTHTHTPHTTQCTPDSSAVPPWTNQMPHRSVPCPWPCSPAWGNSPHSWGAPSGCPCTAALPSQSRTAPRRGGPGCSWWRRWCLSSTSRLGAAPACNAPASARSRTGEEVKLIHVGLHFFFLDKWLNWTGEEGDCLDCMRVINLIWIFDNKICNIWGEMIGLTSSWPGSVS